MDWRSKPRNRDSLSPNWEDGRNEKHHYDHVHLSPQISKKRELIEQDVNTKMHNKSKFRS